MRDVFLPGVLLGISAAFAVGPIFVTIIHEAATRGWMASFRVILGSATADLLLVAPALLMSWLIASISSAAYWISCGGAGLLIVLGIGAGRDAWRLWHGHAMPPPAAGWSFWKG